MPDVISNSSPLQYLYQTGLLTLLPTLYGRIVVPQAVLVKAKRSGRLDAVTPILARLEALRFRLDPETRSSVLKLAGEAP